jgi:chromosomal replication initiator protein
MVPPSLWTGVLRRLADEIGPFAMQAWVHPLVAEETGDRLRLLCPSAYHRDRVRDRWLEPIARCAEAEAARPVRISLDLGSARECGSSAEARPERPAAPPAMAASAPPRRPPPARPPVQYRFDNFVVGPCNALAREACVAIAAGRQSGLAAIYLAGDTGIGKTHLARAVVATAAETGGARAVYASAEAFTSEFQAAVRGERMAAFKRRYRSECDLLVIEDVQFLAGKKGTQLELFHTVAHLLDVGGRVVFTGDRLPADVPDLDPRLRSRLAVGLIAELEAPDLEVRRRILRAKAAAGGVHLPDECLELLAVHLRGSVRELEAALIQLVATSALLKRRIDRPLTEAALRKVATQPGPARRLLPEDVVEVVAGFFKTSPSALASRSRRRDVLLPRQLAMYLCHRYTQASLADIGRAFDRDHPSVSNAIRGVERQMLERAPLRYQVEALSAKLEERLGRAPR